MSKGALITSVTYLRRSNGSDLCVEICSWQQAGQVHVHVQVQVLSTLRQKCNTQLLHTARTDAFIGRKVKKGDERRRKVKKGEERYRKVTKGEERCRKVKKGDGR